MKQSPFWLFLWQITKQSLFKLWKRFFTLVNKLTIFFKKNTMDLKFWYKKVPILKCGQTNKMLQFEERWDANNWAACALDGFVKRTFEHIEYSIHTHIFGLNYVWPTTTKFKATVPYSITKYIVSFTSFISKLSINMRHSKFTTK